MDIKYVWEFGVRGIGQGAAQASRRFLYGEGSRARNFWGC
jgi:hypothetical protein